MRPVNGSCGASASANLIPLVGVRTSVKLAPILPARTLVLCPIVNLMRAGCLTALAKISCTFPRLLPVQSRLSTFIPSRSTFRPWQKLRSSAFNASFFSSSDQPLMSAGRGGPISSVYRQNQTRAQNAADNHAPAARKGLIILCPKRSHAKADKANASVMRPALRSSHVAFEVGSSADRLSITPLTLSWPELAS
jgi:hypothetical protein